MKKWLAVGLIALFLCAPGIALAAGTVTQTLVAVSTYNSLLTFNWTGDAANGTVPATESTWNLDGYVFLVITDPDTPAPDPNYDITLTDANGVDVMGGELMNRHTTNSEAAVPKIGTTVYGTRWVSGKITLNITNQAAAGAKGAVKVYIWSGR